MFTTCVRSFQLNRSAVIPPNHLWTYVCLFDTLYAHEKDGTIPEGTATGEAPNAIPENWRSYRRINSPCNRRLSALKEERAEVTKRIAIYARVSTADQHPETQLLDLRLMAKQRGYEVVHEYTDIISGAKSRRPGFDELLADARRHRFDIVLVAAFDRVARSVRHFLEVLDELNRLGIEFVSFRENIDTGGPLGRAMVVIVGAIAELERSLIVERVKAGMRRAKMEGRQIGRKPLDIDRDQVVRDRFSGMSLSQVAKKHRISRASVCRLVKESDATTHALNKAA
jgi:DNA invertase Pin-like site-specific DNA recombinase